MSLESRIDQLLKFGRLFYVMAAALFALGAWMARLEGRLTTLELGIHEMRVERAATMREWQQWRERVTERLSAIETSQQEILQTIRRSRSGG